MSAASITKRNTNSNCSANTQHSLHTQPTSTSINRGPSNRQQQHSFSLAGVPTAATTPPPLYPRATNSFVTAEYQQLNPNYDKAEDRPIWGLAKPFPRIVRPGMRPRGSALTSAANVPALALKHDPESRLPQTVHDARYNEQIPGYPSHPRSDTLFEYTRSKTSHPPKQSSTLHAASPAQLYAEESSDLRPISLQDHGISEHDQATITSSLHEPKSRDFAPIGPPSPGEEDRGDYFGTTTSETDHEVGAGRQRLQEHANIASLDPVLQAPTAAIDWEEYYNTGEPTRTRPSVQEEAKRKEMVEEEQEEHFHNKWAKFRHRYRQPLAEFLGTLVAMTIGISASIVHQTANNEYGNFLSANLAWGIGIMLGIYTSGGVSGAHLNPAISLTLSIFRGFPFRHCFYYLIAQLIACFAAAGIAYALYRDAIHNVPASLVDSGTGLAFYTQPQPFVSNATAFFTEFVATAILSCCILALGDDSNAPPGAGMAAFITGLLVTGLTLAFSYNTGCCLNPVRDLGPRLVTLAAGYGPEVFTARNCWWIWGPWCATTSGSLAGAWCYDVLVFVGGESPVNYPGGRWKDGIRAVQDAVVVVGGRNINRGVQRAGSNTEEIGGRRMKDIEVGNEGGA